MLSRFTPGPSAPGLAPFLPDRPGFYPAGRLDRDSEGLLLLTDNGRLQDRISGPRHKLPKTYLVQVEGAADDNALALLRNGVELKDGPARAASARMIPEPDLWPRDPPVRPRPGRATSWLEIVLTEGRNRQVRRMTAAVGLPTLRLVRSRIGDWRVDGLAPGEWRETSVHLPVDARGGGTTPRGRRRGGPR